MDEIEELIEALDFAIEGGMTDISMEYLDSSEVRIIFPNGNYVIVDEDSIKDSDEEYDGDTFEL